MQRWLIFAASVVVTCALFTNFCNLAFGCGCTWMWAGAADHCNIHHGPKRCPWCEFTSAGQFGVWLTMAVPQGFIAFWRTRWKWPLRLGLTLLAFPVAGGLAALVTGLVKGYWNH